MRGIIQMLLSLRLCEMLAKYSNVFFNELPT